VGTGLLLRSLGRLLEVDLGFHPDRVVAWRIAPNRVFATHAQASQFHQEMLDKISALPGVESASLAATLPLDINDILHVRAKGQAYSEVETPSTFIREVDRGYFKTMGIPLRSGRDFDSHDNDLDWHDSSSVEKPVIINQRLANLLWPGNDPVGRLLLLENPPDPPATCKVIGLVNNVRQSALDQEPGPELYMLNWGRELVIRTTRPWEGLAMSIQTTLHQLDPNMAVNEFRPLRKIVDRALSPRRFVAGLLSLFSLLSLLLAAVGVYGLIAYSVTQRTHEIGIRLAIGSTRIRVLRLILLDGMRLTFFGCAAGLAASLMLTRLIRSMLFEIRPIDPLTLTAVVLLLATVALIACWVPAWRAAQINPIRALRTE
jgi:predicted permease